jgi:hypothetical protein
VRRTVLALVAAIASTVVAASGCSSARSASLGPGPTHATVDASNAMSGAAAAATSAPRSVRTATRPDALARALPRQHVRHHRANPCRHNTAAKFVRVSLRQQHLWLCAHRHLVRSAAITSGMVGQYTATPTGRYAIQGRDRHSTLTLATGQQYAVKYWIPFNAPLFGFHDASWQTFPFGSPKYRHHGSHGCVHMPLRAIAFLYHWADIGTPVRITA